MLIDFQGSASYCFLHRTQSTTCLNVFRNNSFLNDKNNVFCELAYTCNTVSACTKLLTQIYGVALMHKEALNRIKWGSVGRNESWKVHNHIYRHISLAETFISRCWSSQLGVKLRTPQRTVFSQKCCAPLTIQPSCCPEDCGFYHPSVTLQSHWGESSSRQVLTWAAVTDVRMLQWIKKKKAADFD